MELAFESRELRSICEQEPIANDVLGVVVAEVLRHRLADLRAATSIDDLVAGSPHTVESEGICHIVVDLCRGCQIVLKANIRRILLQRAVGWIGLR